MPILTEAEVAAMTIHNFPSLLKSHEELRKQVRDLWCLLRDSHDIDDLRKWLRDEKADNREWVAKVLAALENPPL